MRKRSVHYGFTLIELLIVVVILGIIAAIVIPTFSIATGDAMDSTLETNLATIRSQLQLYKLQHNNDLPPEATVPLLDELTKYTEADDTHTTVAVGALSGDEVGPYLFKIPDNPYTETNDVSLNAVQADGTDASAWWYDKEAEISMRANDNQTHYNNL